MNAGDIRTLSEPAAPGSEARPLLAPVFSGRRRVLNRIGIAAWIGALLFFWAWWLQPQHIVSVGRYLAVTIPLLWITLIPAWFIFLFAGARVPGRNLGSPSGARAAMVVTKAPSEPFSLVRQTLEGALRQRDVKHDVWLADEDPTPDVRAWCCEHGVGLCSRKGVTEYHRSDWPRRTRSKEGNLAFFYDTIGYDRYDFVSQFDADHVPDPDYLRHALAPFADPSIGYVSAPSICDSNACESWSARGRLDVEASLHGALQTGYNGGWAPLCIGSHYTVRTAALRAVGGLGPELAEDHSTTMILNAGGWRGVHAVDAIAHGKGPETFADLVVQEFQWSRSLVTILLKYTPKYLSALPPRLRFQFLFSQLWYPMFSGFMALMFVLPLVALWTGRHFVDVNYIDFFLHMVPLSITLLVLAWWWRSTGLFRPADVKIVSWEGIAFLLLRWPWSLIGSATAVWDRITGVVAAFRITPKGAAQTEHLPFRVIGPYAGLALASGLSGFLVTEPGTAAGFYVFTLMNAVVFGGLLLLILWRHARENRLSFFPRSASGFGAVLTFAAIAATVVGGIWVNGPKGLEAINRGFTAFTTTQTLFPVAGAGQQVAPRIRVHPQWRGFSSSSGARGMPAIPESHSRPAGDPDPVAPEAP